MPLSSPLDATENFMVTSAWLDIYYASFLGILSCFFDILEFTSPTYTLAIIMRQESNSVLEDVTCGLSIANFSNNPFIFR